MQKYPLTWYSLLAFCCLLRVAAGSRASSLDQISPYEFESYFSSVIHVERRVFASTKLGLYSADATEESWIKLKTPPGMPKGGKFATGSSSGGPLIYYVMRTKPVNGDDDFSSRPGIYVSSDHGATWRFVSARLMSCMHIRGNSVFGIENVEYADANGNRHYRDLILESNDGCRSWNDITANIAVGYGLLSIHDDPLNEEGVLLYGQCLRMVRLHRPMGWSDWIIESFIQPSQRLSPVEFFAPTASGTRTCPIVGATLKNYFRLGFNGCITKSLFQIETSKALYEFGEGESRIVSATISILDEEQPQTLVDLQQSLQCWNLRVRKPDGTQVYVTHPAIDPTVDAATMRQSSDFVVLNLNTKSSYERKVDLESYQFLDHAGTFEVQLLYNNLGIADESQEEWRGSFSGNVFTVIIP